LLSKYDYIKNICLSLVLWNAFSNQKVWKHTSWAALVKNNENVTQQEFIIW